MAAGLGVSRLALLAEDYLQTRRLSATSSPAEHGSWRASSATSTMSAQRASPSRPPWASPLSRPRAQPIWLTRRLSVVRGPTCLLARGVPRAPLCWLPASALPSASSFGWVRSS
jgi:hypothetical protein